MGVKPDDALAYPQAPECFDAQGRERSNNVNELIQRNVVKQGGTDNLLMECERLKAEVFRYQRRLERKQHQLDRLWEEFLRISELLEVNANCECKQPEAPFIAKARSFYGLVRTLMRKA